ncbi:beta-hexosaminidase subunit beta-like [Babylonia areolata]|uniref:beta-hexosaminidase subunit beta-like n=1 Tax=Babylonia areolata TaxID=304850 RepID=UPI003FD349EA
MARRFFITLFVVVVAVFEAFSEIMFIAERLPLKGDRTLSDVPWPMPASWSRDATPLTLHPSSLFFHSNMAHCDVIDDAISRYRHLLSLLKDDSPQSESDLKQVEITVESEVCEELPYLDMDETYSLQTHGARVTIVTHTVWGALRGLETFSQLPYEDSGKVQVNRWTITDRPRFPHRGFMIDTARHYLPLAIIKKHLDAMTWSKLNVLHWHIVDAQSFPFVSRTFPELSGKGAFSPSHVYKPEDVSEVIEYARLRGIRVIPEFDTPGHAHSWGKGKPELLTPCWAEGHPNRAVHGSHAEAENMDPTRNSTFRFLHLLMQEVKDVFRDHFLHAGMDEAHYMCWESSPNISDFMEEHNIGGNYSKLEQYYVTKALDIMAGTGKDVIIWQDPLDNGASVNNRIVVEVWKQQRNETNCNVNASDGWQHYAALVASSGNRMIISSCWYLNFVSYGEDWRHFYACDPQSFTDDPAEQALVLGGEACMWAEFVDGTNFLQRSWPRAAAVAERLWSPGHVTDMDTAAFRLDAHRCRLLRRGVPASPILPGYCGHYDNGMGTQHQNALTASGTAVTWAAASWLIVPPLHVLLHVVFT